MIDCEKLQLRTQEFEQLHQKMAYELYITINYYVSRQPKVF